MTLFRDLVAGAARRPGWGLLDARGGQRGGALCGHSSITKCPA